MKADFRVFLDACVLANYGVCDLLLRLAEKPRQFLPAWSKTVMDEVFRTHTLKLNWPEDLAESFQKETEKAFPDACVDHYGHLISQVTNHEKDRHVLAAAICSGSSLILTFNLKDFPSESLERWHLRVQHPQDYLLTLYEMEPMQVISRLAAIAAKRNLDQQDLLLKLGKALPKFSSRLIDELKLY